jgi:Icc-related predicted phosphoesterase
MKVLVVSDLHYALKQFDWVLRVAQEFDVVIIAGDLLDMSAHVDGRAQIVVVLKYLQRLSAMTKLVVCSGNHDLDARDADGERTAKWLGQLRKLNISSDGDSFVGGDMLFSICPWWDGQLARSRIAEQFERDAARRTGKWAWVYHAPPTGSATSWDGRRAYGDEALAKWIGEYAPDFVFSGHVHTAPFCPGGSWIDRLGRTWVFNAGFQIGPAPASLVLDTFEKAVLWSSTGRREYVGLNETLQAPLVTAGLPACFRVLDQTLEQAQG